ncbi:MAG TPA: hypothetical protein VLS27_20350 [Gammaproteobacteria bacterium]|nr:hypothetical protein [Gammaproteobacteria bacterium]
MELWMKIGSAILLVIMLIVIFPRARQMIAESPKGSAKEWLSALIPLGLVAAFVVLLVMMV